MRRCRLIATDHPHATFATTRGILQQAVAVRDRYQSGVVSAQGLAVARGHLIARLVARLARPSGVPDVERFATHLNRDVTAIWSLLFDPTIDAINWRAEHSIRPIVNGARSVVGIVPGRVPTVSRFSYAEADGVPRLRGGALSGPPQRDVNPHLVLASMLHLRTPRVVAELN